MQKKFLIFLFFFIFTSILYSSENDDAKKTFNFAENLFQNKDYFRAITEYKRLIFSYPDDNLASQSKYKIGLCYYNGEKYDLAIKEFQEVINNYSDKNEGKIAFIGLSNSYFKKEDYKLAINELTSFIEDNESHPKINSVYYKSGIISLYDNNKDMALNNFRKTGNNELINSVMNFDKIEQKSPVLAGSLSAVFPGLGQIYAKRYNDGIISFLLNGIFIWGAHESFKNKQNTTGGIITFFELGWYSGNIFNAVNSTHKYNRDQKINYIENIKNKFQDLDEFKVE